MTSFRAHPFIKWFADITIADIPLVGGKNGSLGGMVRELAGKGVKVPDGFAITAEAFRHFIREAGIDERIRATLADLDTHNMANLSERGQALRQTILNATLAPDLQRLISEAYRRSSPPNAPLRCHRLPAGLAQSARPELRSDCSGWMNLSFLTTKNRL